jgi:hypothetical protein
MTGSFFVYKYAKKQYISAINKGKHEQQNLLSIIRHPTRRNYAAIFWMLPAV